MPADPPIIPFTLPDGEARNSRAFSCCCPERVCPKGIIEQDVRVARSCKPGYLPFFKVYNGDNTIDYASAFDVRSAGVSVPVYKHQEISSSAISTASIAIRAKHYTAGTADGTYSFNSRYSLSSSASIASEFLKPMEHWPASNQTAGPCPDRSTITPDGIPSPTFSILATGDTDGIPFPEPGDPPVTTVAVKFSWLDVRVDDPDSETEPPAKLGSYEVSLDGGSAIPAGISHDDGTGTLTFNPTAYVAIFADSDHAIHTIRARLVIGGSNGQWSTPVTFNIASPACADFVGDCETWSTTGNLQVTPDAATVAAAESWTSINSTTDPTTQTGGSTCPETVGGDPPTGATNVPADLGVLPNNGANLIAAANHRETISDTQSPSTYAVIQRGSWPIPDPDHEDGPGDPPTDPPAEVDPTPPEGETLSGWYVTLDYQVATITTNETTERTVDQNGGYGTVASMRSAAASIVSGWDGEWAWGHGANYITIELGPDLNVSHGVRCYGSYPITDGYTVAGGSLFCSYAQMRYRWEVPSASLFTGNSYRVRWSVAKFDDRWMIWRERYIVWALKKKAFLTKPEPGDPDYPVLADYFDDPDTPVNEAQEQLDAAIALIDAITDPGSAPAEPTDLRPSIVGTYEWEWSKDGATSRPIPVLDFCDPTRLTRESEHLEMSPPPDRADFPEGTEGDEAYAEAVADRDAAIASWNERSKRLSDWYTIDPDRASDAMQPKTGAGPLASDYQNSEGKWNPGGEDAYNAAHAAWESSVAWRAARFSSHERIHESYRICDVRFSCGASLGGDLAEEWDRSYPTTSLPVIDATSINSWDWYWWEIWYRAGGTGVPSWYVDSDEITT